MNRLPYIAFLFLLTVLSTALSAQTFKAARLQKAAEVLGLEIQSDSLLAEQTYLLTARDGRIVNVRTDPMGEIEHIGAPLFNGVVRFLQPSPVYDFLEFAVLNKKYNINPNQLYLNRVIFRKGTWDTLLQEKLSECNCTISNQDDQLYIVTWTRQDSIVEESEVAPLLIQADAEGEEVACIGIPIDYELLCNDTRRNMERDFVRQLSASQPLVERPTPPVVNDNDLSIYGTGGLFVMPGSSYLIDLLNQNVYYLLTTTIETADTIIRGKRETLTLEAILPVVVRDDEFPAETFANLMMCDNAAVPDATVSLDIHLSDYHRDKLVMPLSQLKAFLRQQGCSLFFACNGISGEKMQGIMFASNIQRGYNHMLSLRTETEQLTDAAPTVSADMYLYIPPINKEKLFAIPPAKKSKASQQLPALLGK